MTLFVEGRFRAHSGEYLDEKIECDALTDFDWKCLAHMVVRRLKRPQVRDVIGVPRGGLPFANAFMATGLVMHTSRDDLPMIVVDDVLTTGRSLLEVMAKYPRSLGYVVFDRSGKPLPPNVRALFTLNP